MYLESSFRQYTDTMELFRKGEFVREGVAEEDEDNDDDEDED